MKPSTAPNPAQLPGAKRSLSGVCVAVEMQSLKKARRHRTPLQIFPLSIGAYPDLHSQVKSSVPTVLQAPPMPHVWVPVLQGSPAKRAPENDARRDAGATCACNIAWNVPKRPLWHGTVASETLQRPPVQPKNCRRKLRVKVRKMIPPARSFTETPTLSTSNNKKQSIGMTNTFTSRVRVSHPQAGQPPAAERTGCCPVSESPQRCPAQPKCRQCPAAGRHAGASFCSATRSSALPFAYPIQPSTRLPRTHPTQPTTGPSPHTTQIRFFTSSAHICSIDPSKSAGNANGKRYDTTDVQSQVPRSAATQQQNPDLRRPQNGTKSDVAQYPPPVVRSHMEAYWLHRPCHFGGLKNGDEISSGHITLAILGAHMWANHLH